MNARLLSGRYDTFSLHWREKSGHCTKFAQVYEDNVLQPQKDVMCFSSYRQWLSWWAKACSGENKTLEQINVLLFSNLKPSDKSMRWQLSREIQRESHTNTCCTWAINPVSWRTHKSKIQQLFKSDLRLLSYKDFRNVIYILFQHINVSGTNKNKAKKTNCCTSASPG